MKFLTIVLLSAVLASVAHAEITCKGRTIFDANGKPLVMKGVNNAHADWDNFERSYALNALDAINAAGANAVRVQLRHLMNYNGADKNRKLLSDSHIDRILAKIKSLGLVAIVQLHDATGSDDPNELVKCAEWFAKRVGLWNKYRDNLIINIANEWSTFGTSGQKWYDAYTRPIRIIRGSQWKGCLLIDAPAYAQDPTAIINNGTNLINNVDNNLAFSLHVYADWKKSNPRYTPGNHIKQIVDKNLCLVIGEYADTHPSKENGVCKSYEMLWENLLSECNARSVSYFSWSWHGNGDNECGKPLSELNMIDGDPNNATTWRIQKFTRWGQRAVAALKGAKKSYQSLNK